ncbi:hypothetical protein [Arenicella chitinivorans]|uniref:hypothetical protein n=1 Tax=Arenicella chitinivorans TaxID=1329800 RepID=UPI001678E155|nr:hypothetical protein [Arenicella chitinivorans]
MASNHRHAESGRQARELVFNTGSGCWVVPCQRELVKILIRHESVCARSLCFESPQACRDLLRSLFLLALEDEVQTEQPSSLAQFARDALRFHNASLSM